MQYNASLDPLAKGITLGYFVLVAVVGALSAEAWTEPWQAETVIKAFTPVVLLLLGGISWLVTARGYILTDESLVIQRPIGNKIIPREAILHVRVLEKSDTRGAIRTFGIGGLFGYTGTFYIPRIGSATFFATQRKNLLLLSTDSKKRYVISPDDASMAIAMKPNGH